MYSLLGFSSTGLFLRLSEKRGYKGLSHRGSGIDRRSVGRPLVTSREGGEVNR